MRARKGSFIVIEGLDGAGKTTLSKLLVRDLRKFGTLATWTTEPSNSSVGKILRRVILKGRKASPDLEALMFAADRFLHLENEVVPALGRGLTVVSDRYVYASLAYQGAQGLTEKWLRKINSFARKPDLALYLDIPPEVGLRRLKRSKSVMENVSLLRKVRRNYLKMVQREELILVDASGPISLVREEILRAVIRR